MTTDLTTSPNRRYDIDAVRVIALGLLIVYHTCMFYVQDWGWHIKSQYQVEWLQHPMMFLNQWRMALLFVISGVATAMLLCKTDRPFLLPRFKKLGVPLLFGMFVIVVPQAYYEALANGATDVGYLSFWWRYVSFSQWPEGAFAGSDFGVTWNHLWYLPYILFYSVVLALLVNVTRRLNLRWPKLKSGNLTVWYAVMLPVLMFCGLVIFPLFPEKTHALIDDWYNHSLYFSFFVLGYALMQSEGVWQALKQHRFNLLALGTIAYVTMRLLAGIQSEDSSIFSNVSFTLAIYVNRLTWVFVVLAFAYSVLNKPSKVFRYANKAVFSWYILHQTLTVILGAWLTPLTLGGGLEGCLVLVGTILACLLIHHYIVRNVRFLHLFFGYSEGSSELTGKQHIAQPASVAG